MFRPNRFFAPLVALALLGLSACAESPAPRAASASTATQTVTAPRSTPATPSVEDQSLRLDSGADVGGSCRQQCERSHNVCMDSVAARTQSGMERPDSGNVFTPSDNCGYQLRQCFQRCNTAR